MVTDPVEMAFRRLYYGFLDFDQNTPETPKPFRTRLAFPRHHLKSISFHAFYDQTLSKVA